MPDGQSCALALWADACDRLRGRISKTSFEQWIACIVPLGVEGDTIRLGVNDEFFADWLKDNMGDVLSAAIAEAAGREMAFQLESGHTPKCEEPACCEDGSGYAEFGLSASSPSELPRSSAIAPNCHARNTFKNFVVGEENRYAYTAALTAAQSPALYNPLYIYGSTGLGKTHLVQAVANHVLQGKPDAVIEYVTCEEFLNHYVESLKNKSHSEFRNRFRKVDMLLVDDVHHLGNKGALQEEFFNTFNTLYNSNKQIIMTSDKQPSEINGLESRLVSRFESGVTTQITQPSYETRLAILRLKQEEHLVKLGEDVLSLIATKVSSSVRHLEGALMRLAAYSSAMGGISIDSRTAEAILRDLIDKESASRIITIETIQRVVAERFNLHVHDIIGSKRPKNIAEPRMIAMYLSRKLTNHSLPEIGMAFGGRNHATVIHGVRQVEAECEADEQTKKTVATLRRQLQGC